MNQKLFTILTVFFFILLFLILSPSLNPVSATTINVNTINDELNSDGDCSLREAIEAANTDSAVDTCPAGETEDTIEVPAGTYTLTIEGQNEDANQTGDLDILAGTLTINGAGSSNTTIQAGMTVELGIDRVFHVDGQGVAFTLQGVTIANGNCQLNCNGAGILNDIGAYLTITDSKLTYNLADNGGAIYNDSNATVIISNSNLHINDANIGGGIFNSPGATLSISNSTLTFNDSGFGGAIHNEGSLAVSTSTFSSNDGSSGGGIYNYGLGASATVTNSIFSNNNSNAGGGGIFNTEAATMSISESTISDNGNEAPYGGGIYNSAGGTLTVNTSQIYGNNATNNGNGGLGGGIFNSGSDSTINLLNSSVFSNSASDGGGGIFNEYGILIISNGTVSGNSTSGSGGGIYNVDNGIVEVMASTFSENSVLGEGLGGALYNNENAITTLQGSIIANSSSSTNCAGPIVDAGYNLQFGGAEADSCGESIPTADPNLGPLQDNGGPTFTHALLPGSAAIDSGDNTNCPATDQRGVARPIDGDGNSTAICDIGAYEKEEPEIDQLTALDPAEVWIGLKNSDDVGIKFDLLAEAYKDSTLISAGQIDSVRGGNSGFNNANLQAINFNSFSPIDFPPGSILSIKVYARNACIGSGKNSGQARLWYNDSAANSRFGTTIGGTQSDRYLIENFVLSNNPGDGLKEKVDVAAGAKCSPFKLFGTWSITP